MKVLIADDDRLVRTMVSDLLVDLGDAVATMVDALRDRESVDRDAMLRAAATLRDPGATPDACAAAAAELERLAAEKEARLRT